MGGVKTVRVFVCDDSQSLRRLVALQLAEDARFVLVGEADCAEECVRGVTELAPDVLLLDHGVPVDDWDRLLADLRHGAPEVAILLFSGLPRALLAEEARAHGLDGYMEKGQPAPEFRRALGAAVGDRAPGAPGSGTN